MTGIAALTEFDNLPIPCGVLEIDGTLVAVNPAAALLVATEAAHLVGRKAWELAPGADLIWQDLVSTARKQGVCRGQITLSTADAPVMINYALSLRSYQGREVVLGFAIAAGEAGRVDVSQRVDALGLVAGGIAHDFNNQLVSVLAEASAARADSNLGESSREALRRIEAAAHRMTQLTRQLLAYAGRGRLVTELLDPEELVRRSEEQLSRSVRDGAALVVRTAAGRVALEADRQLLQQVIANLVSNASDALEGRRGTIRIATRTLTRAEGTQWWCLQIGDDGVGIEPHLVKRIFDPFFTTKPDRHGLGLSAVHGIVRRLGGEITVDSRRGEGTIVDVRLPVVAGVAPTRKFTPPGGVQIGTLLGKRALVADDEPSVRTTVRRLLERRGAVVVTAADGAEAEARLSEGSYDVILLDVMMPNLTGYQLLGPVRRLQPGASVMLMSGYVDDARGAGGEVEPDAFLEKPFTARALDEAIDTLIARLR